MSKTEWILEGLIAKNSISLFVGTLTGFKTIAFLNIARAISEGVKWYGLATQKTNVLYFDTLKEDIWGYVFMKGFFSENNYDFQHYYFAPKWNCPHLHEALMKNLNEWVNEFKDGVFIIDSFEKILNESDVTITHKIMKRIEESSLQYNASFVLLYCREKEVTVATLSKILEMEDHIDIIYFLDYKREDEKDNLILKGIKNRFQKPPSFVWTLSIPDFQKEEHQIRIIRQIIVFFEIQRKIPNQMEIIKQARRQGIAEAVAKVLLEKWAGKHWIVIEKDGQLFYSVIN